MKTNRKFLAVAAVVALLASACAGAEEPAAPAPAPSPDASGADSGVSSEGFYKDQVIEVIVPVGAGGGTDAQGRLVASQMQRWIDGNPTVQVVNLVGGGGILGGNQFFQQRPDNGLHLIMMGPSTLLPWLLGNPDAQYDLSEMTPLWAGPMPHVGYLRSDLGLTTVKDLLNPPERIIFGATGPTGADLPMILALEALEILDDMQVVFGYRGGAAKANAFEAGELSMDRRPSGTYMRLNRDAYESGEQTVLFTLGLPDGQGGLMRDPLFPDKPHMEEAYIELHDREPESEAWDAFMLLYTEVLVNGGYSFWTFKSAPEEAIDALRTGLSRMTEDPGYAEVTTELIGPYEQITGDAVEAWATSLENLDLNTLQWIRDFVADRYDVRF